MRSGPGLLPTQFAYCRRISQNFQLMQGLYFTLCILVTLDNSNYGKKMRTDGPTDGPTDGRMDKPSYRDARTHLKIRQQIFAIYRISIRGCVRK